MDHVRVHVRTRDRARACNLRALRAAAVTGNTCKHGAQLSVLALGVQLLVKAFASPLTSTSLFHQAN